MDNFKYLNIYLTTISKTEIRSICEDGSILVSIKPEYDKLENQSFDSGNYTRRR